MVDLDGTAEVSGTAAEHLLLSLARHGIEHVFSNLGTDHTPIIEAHARLADAGLEDAIPELLVCQHEFVAMSAAHGYAASTGRPQAVLVHVDVGTQNLGASLHNAHRSETPILVMAGLAPVSDRTHPGARDADFHYFQDVFDQTGILREYCRWTDEYRPPADPDATIARALDRATGSPPGPVYLTATREALETTVESPRIDRRIRDASPTVPDESVIDQLATDIHDAEAPLLITGSYDGALSTIVEFAEAAGAGIIESSPTRLSFPRDHDLHLGFDATSVFEHADLLLLADTHVPWVPAQGSPPPDVNVVQIDPNPTKGAYPHWDFQVGQRIPATPQTTLAALTRRIETLKEHTAGSTWLDYATDRRERLSRAVSTDRTEGLLTPRVLTRSVASVIDDDSIVIEDAVSNGGVVKRHLPLGTGNEYFWKGGSGLGWAGGAAVGAKMAHPDRLVVALVGDGSYLFSHPSISALFGSAVNAPTLTVIYNNGGWRAVKTSVREQHPEGKALEQNRTYSGFDPSPDLTKPAEVVDAHTAKVTDLAELRATLEEGREVVDGGRSAVIDVRLDQSAG